MKLVDPTDRVTVVENLRAIKRATLLSLMSHRSLRRAASASGAASPRVASFKQAEQKQQQPIAVSEKSKESLSPECASLQSIRRDSFVDPSAVRALAAAADETGVESEKLHALVEMCMIRYALEMFHLGRSFEDAEYVW